LKLNEHVALLGKIQATLRGREQSNPDTAHYRHRVFILGVLVAYGGAI